MLLALSALPMGAVHATSTNATLNGFQGVNSEFSSEKDVYYWMLAELADAVSNINTEVAPNDDEKKNDPVFAFDAALSGRTMVSLCVCVSQCVCLRQTLQRLRASLRLLWLRVVVSRPLTALLLFRSTMAGATGQVR